VFLILPSKAIAIPMQRIKARLAEHPITIGISVFLVVTFITLYVSFRVYQLEQASELAQVKEQTEHIKEQLVSALSNSASSTLLLAFLVEKDLLKDNFEVICRDLLEQNPFIDALQLVEGGVIKKVYPYEGNEPAVGLNIMDDPTHYQAALTSIKQRALYFEGPFELIQGGIGVVGRKPIFKEGKFWGFAASIVKLNTLMKATGIADVHSHFEYQLCKGKPGEVHVDVFYGESQLFNSGIYHREYVPAGNWIINVRLRKSMAFRQSLPLAGIGFFPTPILLLPNSHLPSSQTPTFYTYFHYVFHASKKADLLKMNNPSIPLI
jgi:sensor domain CHASE-containing protein